MVVVAAAVGLLSQAGIWDFDEEVVIERVTEGVTDEVNLGLLEHRVTQVVLAVVAAAVGLSSFRGALSDLDIVASLAVAPLALVAALPFGPLPEELGWRGFAQPRLLDLVADKLPVTDGQPPPNPTVELVGVQLNASQIH